MISCKQATELISKSADEPLTTHEKLSLFFHMKLCTACVNFRDQVLSIRSFFRKGKDALMGTSSPTKAATPQKLSPEAKKRIKEKLQG